MPEERSSFFTLNRENDYEEFLHFLSIYEAAKKTGISATALRNACKKANMTIMR